MIIPIFIFNNFMYTYPYATKLYPTLKCHKLIKTYLFTFNNKKYVKILKLTTIIITPNNKYTYI